MTSPEDVDDEAGAPARACASCRHPAREHHIREIEVPGNTIRGSYYLECAGPCEFIPGPNGQ